MSEHSYSVGQNVHLIAGPYSRGRGAGGVYKIVKLLPADGDDPLYRIKSANEPHERVAKESQLDRKD